MIIAIDGPAGTGKSTVAKMLAEHLQFEYFDTGAMYRAATWFLFHRKIPWDNLHLLEKTLADFDYRIVNENGRKRYYVGEKEVTEEIRLEAISALVSTLSAIPVVRKALVKKQIRWVKGKNVIVEGRDMGTVVFPKADLKIFLTASAEERAKRRYEQCLRQFPDKAAEFDEKLILEEIQIRDERDSTRAISPLRCAKDAVLVETTDLSLEEVVKKILQLYRKGKNLHFKRFFSMKWGYGFVLMCIWTICRLFYRIHVHGLEHFIEKRAIIAANHLSYLDPPILAISCPEEIYFLAKGKLFSIPIFGALIRYLNTLPVSGLVADLKTFKQIAQILKKEKKVLLFPEGTRSLDENMRPLQSGVGFLAQLTDSPVLPVYLKGTDKVWGRDRKFPKLFGEVTCIFGSPITPSMWKDLPKKELTHWITKRLEKSFEELVQWEKEGCQGTPP